MEFKLVKFKCWLILLFSKENGDLLQHIFNAPPDNLDGVCKTYLEGKFRTILSDKEFDFIRSEYKNQYESLYQEEIFNSEIKKEKELFSDLSFKNLKIELTYRKERANNFPSYSDWEDQPTIIALKELIKEKEIKILLQGDN